MTNRAISFNISVANLYEPQLEFVAKWLSCNGTLWGVGPTGLFASAAAVFLYSELQSSLIIPGDNAGIPVMEKTLLTTMVLGLLALMVHIWVCSMRFFQYYLDALIKESPNLFLEMTTAGILGQSELVVLGPLTRFLRQQQPQIHITICWFLSLCYADYVRKHYCQRFNMPYLEHWQIELHACASRAARSTLSRAQSIVSAVHVRLRRLASASAYSSEEGNSRTEMPSSNACVGSGSSIGGCRVCGMAERRRSTGSLVGQRSEDLWWPLAGKSSETTAAFVKLKAYVQATRCGCVSTNNQSQAISRISGTDIVKVEREMIIQMVSKDNSAKDSHDARSNRVFYNPSAETRGESSRDVENTIAKSSKDAGIESLSKK